MNNDNTIQIPCTECHAILYESNSYDELPETCTCLSCGCTFNVADVLSFIGELAYLAYIRITEN